MLVYSDGDPATSLKSASKPDRAETAELLQKLFPQEKLIPTEDGDLCFTSPDDDKIYAGCFSGVSVVAAKEFGIDYPSKLPLSFLNIGGGSTIHLHAMHSGVDWVAFAIWRGKKLERSLSLSPDSGILEDIGKRLPFEIPFWQGELPALAPEDQEENEESYPFPFHPLELGEAALQDFFGYCLEGIPKPDSLEPGSIYLMRFKRLKRPKWKFW